MTVSRVSLGDVSFNQTYHTHDLGDNNQKGSRDHHGHHTFICSKYFMFPRLSAGIHSCTMFNDSGQPYPKWDFPRCLRTPLEKSFPFKVHSGICKLPHEKYGNTMLSQHPWECDRIQCRKRWWGHLRHWKQRLLLCPGPVKNGWLQQSVVVNVEVVRKIKWYWWRVHIVK